MGTNTGHVPRCPEPGQKFLPFMTSNWFWSLPLERFDSATHIQNAIPKLESHTTGSSWCINYFLPDIKQVCMACSHLLSQGHITHSELRHWQMVTIWKKRIKKVSGRMKIKAMPAGTFVPLIKQVVANKWSQGVSVLAFTIFTLACTPEEPAFAFQDALIPAIASASN